MWNFFETGTGKPKACRRPQPATGAATARSMGYRYRYAFGRLVAVGTPWGQPSDQVGVNHENPLPGIFFSL